MLMRTLLFCSLVTLPACGAWEKVAKDVKDETDDDFGARRKLGADDVTLAGRCESEGKPPVTFKLTPDGKWSLDADVVLGPDEKTVIKQHNRLSGYYYQGELAGTIDLYDEITEGKGHPNEMYRKGRCFDKSADGQRSFECTSDWGFNVLQGTGDDCKAMTFGAAAQPKAEVKTGTKTEAETETKTEAKTETKTEAKPAAKEEPQPEKTVDLGFLVCRPSLGDSLMGCEAKALEIAAAQEVFSVFDVTYTFACYGHDLHLSLETDEVKDVRLANVKPDAAKPVTRRLYGKGPLRIVSSDPEGTKAATIIGPCKLDYHVDVAPFR